MTWNTSRGNRILKGKEAKLFINVFMLIMDRIDMMGEYFYNTEICEFNNITHNQKFVIFKEILIGLFFESELYVDLNQYNECAIYYVFNTLFEEVDDVEYFENVWGQDVIDAYNEVWPLENVEDDDDDNDRPYIGCLDKEIWESAVIFLKEQVLYDEDFIGIIGISRLLMSDLQLINMGIDKSAFEIKFIEEKDNIYEEVRELIHKIYVCEKIKPIQLKFKQIFKKRNNAARVIQNGCHNWIWSPLCKDNTVGIRPRLDYELYKTFTNETT